MHLGQAAGRSLTVTGGQITSGFQHGLRDLIETDAVATIAGQGIFSAIDRSRRRKRIAFDARRLNEAQNRIAGQPEMVLQGHFRSIFALLR